MKKITLLLLSFAATFPGFAQTYSGGGGSIIQLVDTSRFDISVTGLTPANIDNNFGLESVEINITHSSDRDIDCYIASPDGSMIALTTDNGGTGNDYTNTVFRFDAATAISAGSAPFNGTYRPEGDIWRLNNGQNGNGTWQLRVIDDSWNTSTGSVVNWSVTFGVNPPAPFTLTESNLPILILNTGTQTIPDDPKIIADMALIDNGIGNRNHVTDPYNGYNGKIAIEVRGSSSQMFPKKSYGFETRSMVNTAIDSNVSLVGMPSEHDWILNANYSDKSFMHNFLAYQSQREFGHWAPRCKYVDVILNGQYWGIYVLMESIKWDDERVDVNHLRTNENSFPEITGGYIVKIDKQTGSGGDGWSSQYPPINNQNGQDIYFQYDYPDPDSITVQQQSYIQAYIDSFEDALFGPAYMDSALGYMKFIGNNSFIDYFFSNEISKNVDGYRISSYLYKDREKTLKAGPVWDYDIAYGNANYCGGDDTLNWAYLFPCTGDGSQIPAWWPRMLSDSNFTNELRCRWDFLRAGPLSDAHLNGVIDSVASYLNESQAWNFQVWPILGVYVWPNVAPYPTTFAGEVANLKQWLGRRLQWLDANLPGNCNCNLNVNFQDASCSANCDGQAIVNGASSYPLTYTWDNGAEGDTLTSLCVGIYVVTMEDAVGCMKTDTITINSPAGFTATTSLTQSVCGQCNGTASVQIAGGVAPITYLWNTGDTTTSISNLCAGNYSVTVTDATGCAVMKSVLINGSPNVTTIQASADVLCNGDCSGAASVTVTSGTQPYSYAWSPGGYTTSSSSNLCANTYFVTTTDTNGCMTVDTIVISEPAVLTAVSNASQDASCNGASDGSASVAVTGGTQPYTYTWNPSVGTTANVSGLSAGTYTVIVSDNNSCADTAVFIISEPPAITLFTSSTAASCGSSNGTATCTPSGGVAPYTYAWSPIGGTASTATNLPAGNYTIVVTDSNSCVQSAFVSVNNSGAPAMTLQSSNNVGCHGDSTGSAAVNTTGGTPPYTYAWSPAGGNGSSATGLPAGNYVITVTDGNNCISTLNVAILEPPALTASIPATNITCVGICDGAATANVTGGTSGYTYLWCNGTTASSVSALCPGSCTVQITDANNCVLTQSVTITQPATALALNTTHSDASCAGCANGWASANVSGGNGPYSYLWNTVPQQTTSLITNLLPGTYVVCITDANNCTICDSVFVLDASVGINEIASESSPVYVYPNPLSNSASFIFSLSVKQKVLLQVFDARGKLVRELINEDRTGGDHIFKLDATGMSEGVYHYHFRTEERVQDGSIIIQR
jgi:subtilisin-like proprotein convertase family protein